MQRHECLQCSASLSETLTSAMYDKLRLRVIMLWIWYTELCLWRFEWLQQKRPDGDDFGDGCWNEFFDRSSNHSSDQKLFPEETAAKYFAAGPGEPLFGRLISFGCKGCELEARNYHSLKTNCQTPQAKTSRIEIAASKRRISRVFKRREIHYCRNWSWFQLESAHDSELGVDKEW